MARELALAVTLVAGLAGCKRTSTDEPTPVATPGATPALVETATYRIDLVPPSACAASAPCEVRLVLTAQGDYHVNDQYPVKFIAEQGIEGTGTFHRDSEKVGTLRLTARPGRISGTFKLSVCTEENCEIEAPRIAFDVAAL
jgi:hypothetical protein